MNLSRIMSRIRYAILPCVVIEFPFESSWATTGIKGQRSLNDFSNREALWFKMPSRSHHSAQLKAKGLRHLEIAFYESGQLCGLFSKVKNTGESSRVIGGWLLWSSTFLIILRIMYKYEASPPPNIIITLLTHRSQLRISLNLYVWLASLK